MSKLIFLFFFVAIFACCEKETPKPSPTLNEYIVGDWEEREYMDASAFGNPDFNSIGPPYLIIHRFNQDQSYVLIGGNNQDDPLPFTVNEQDSTLILGPSRWELHIFNEAFMEIRRPPGREPIGKRLYKIK